MTVNQTRWQPVPCPKCGSDLYVFALDPNTGGILATSCHNCRYGTGGGASLWTSELTEAERRVLNLLSEANNEHTKLPIQHPHDQHEFMHAIHAAQNIILARPTVRVMGWVKDKNGDIVSVQEPSNLP